MSKDSLEQFGRALRTYVGKLPREMGRAVVTESADNFRRQGYENEAGNVVAWAPRKAADYSKRRGKRVPNPRQRAILVKSGRLRRSVRVVSTTGTSVTVGSSEPYAEAQQDGNGKLPARPFVTLGRSGQQKLVRKIAAGIIGLLQR